MTAAVDPAVVEMMDAVFADYRESQRPAGVEHDPRLWQSLDELGLVRLTRPESAGGSGAGWYESAALLRAAVRHGVRIPLAEHDLLACWLLDSTQTPCDAAVRTVCVLGGDSRAAGVPWARSAARLVVVWAAGDGYRLADVAADADAVTITPGTNRVGEPRDTVTVDTAAMAGTPLSTALVAQLRNKSALVRSIQVCAALDAILECSIEHTTSRTQFGRSLSKFQSVQNLIAEIASEATLARAATEAALSAAVSSGWSAPQLDFLVAVARSCAGHATSTVVRDAHQVHGAIGTTVEHRLPEFTRAALTWRGEFGSLAYWDAQVTDAALNAGADGLWALITG